MNRFKILLALITLAVCAPHTLAQTPDSVDVVDYDLTLDLSNGAPFAAKAVLTVQLERPIDAMSLQLMGTVDTLTVDGTVVANPDLAQIPVAGIAPHTPFTVAVVYRGRNYVESYGWGGFHFDSDMSYNLGVAFNEDPHSIGRAMFPCRDNFTDKATYTLRVKTRTGWTSECGGLKQSAEVDSAGCEHSVWHIPWPTPVYLVSVSQANFRKIQTTAGGYPMTLGFTNQDSSRVALTFRQMDTVVPMFERCFGPYRWERIGYIGTQKGSMEHVNNIALSRSFMASPTSPYGRITIPHEFGHAWFGNLVTCRTEADMWFNEGGASFTSEVAREATSGREAAIEFYQENLESVVRTAHTTDGDWLPLSPMPHSLTYGSTTYDKGALVWHSLRGYLGDSVFYAAMRRLFAEKAFGTVDAYEVRDSLAAYTGVDLTGFFDFHVFTAGFIDYYVALEGDTLRIRQQGYFTNDIMRSSRVPVTFLSADGQSETRWYTLSGPDTAVAVAGLPFVPRYCLLDRDCEISDAVTRGETRLENNGRHVIASTHFTANANDITAPVTIYVDHHWGRPYGLDTVTGVVRQASRYWVVDGDFDYNSGVKGRFDYSRTSGLDEGFFDDAATSDSLVLLHRWASRSTWHCIARYHSSSSEGYFTCNLLPGEYTLAVVDPDLLAIGGGALPTSCPTLFPNPLRRGEALTVEAPFDGPFDIVIIDAAGHKIWSKRGCRQGRALHPNLPAGTYLVVIKNKSVSLQSKLIQL